ncbi:uncharacterized protein G2W53_040343 [Senna tora]|uniref:Uncharacterized protein n=1 Tax=Senna tora TaxID=362788 RepID=A0A834VXY2_9FABA|nr:uncharacterized protein G2W53_040343 [Senna tora]
MDPSTYGEKDIIRPLETDRESLTERVSNDDEETLDEEEGEQKEIEFGFDGTVWSGKRGW